MDQTAVTDLSKEDQLQLSVVQCVRLAFHSAPAAGMSDTFAGALHVQYSSLHTFSTPSAQQQDGLQDGKVQQHALSVTPKHQVGSLNGAGLVMGIHIAS